MKTCLSIEKIDNDFLFLRIENIFVWELFFIIVLCSLELIKKSFTTKIYFLFSILKNKKYHLLVVFYCFNLSSKNCFKK